MFQLHSRERFLSTVFGPLANPILYYINRLLPLASFTIANHLLGSASVVDEMGKGVDQHGLLSNLCTLLVGLLRPTPRSRLPEVTAAGMASLLLGVSLAMMLGGLVTFVIGFILMPWALGTLAVFHLVEVVSHVSLLGKSLFVPAVIPRDRPCPMKISGTFILLFFLRYVASYVKCQAGRSCN